MKIKCVKPYAGFTVGISYEINKNEHYFTVIDDYGNERKLVNSFLMSEFEK